MKKVDLSVTKQNNVDVVRYELKAADVYDERVSDKTNQLANIVHFQYSDEDGRRSITSYVKDGTALEAMLKKTLDKKAVLAIISGLTSAFEVGTQGVPVSYIIKDANYIYVNEENYAVKCLLLPIKQDVMPMAELPMLYREILSKFRYDEKDKDNYVAKLITLVNSDDFTVSKLKELVDKELEQIGFFVSKDNGLTSMNAGQAPVNNNSVKVNKLGVMSNMMGGQPPMGQPMPGAPMGQPMMGGRPPMPGTPQAMMGGQPPMGQSMPGTPMGQPPMMGGQPPMGQPMPVAPKPGAPMGQPPMMGGQPPMGQPMPGAPKPGTPMGQPPMMGGQPPMGQPPMMGGQPTMGQPMPGAPRPGVPMGQPPMMGGQPPMGQPVPGAPKPGAPMGQPPIMGGQPPMGQPMTGAPMPGAPMGQPPMMGGQPPMGQPMPGAPKPGAPMGQPPIMGGQPPMGQPMPQAPAKPIEPEAKDIKEENIEEIEESPFEEIKPQDTKAQDKAEDNAQDKAEDKVEVKEEISEETAATPEMPVSPGMPVSPEMPKPPVMPVSPVMPVAPQGMPSPAPVEAPKPGEFTMGNLVGQLGSKPVPHIVRKNTGEAINITKPEFTIGKSKTKADYAIENNTAISRVHCIIVQRDGVNYIKDNNSTNHTYVNGVELEPGKEVLLKNKTVIQLGDEEFTFLLRKGE